MEFAATAASTAGTLASLALAAAAALPLPARAVEYGPVDAAKSSLAFGYRQMGVGMDGRFTKFAVRMSFDPAKPAAAKAAIDVDLASIDTGVADVDKEVQGRQWFDAKQFPTARFESSAVKPLGANKYEIAGKLTIKGRTRDVVAPVTYTVQGSRASFVGGFAFKRADFAIGEGPWAAFDAVANEIEVKFQIVADAGR